MLFKRRSSKHKKGLTDISRGATLTSVLRMKIAHKQRIVAERLQVRFQRLPQGSKWILLYLFCLSGLMLSGWQLSGAFSNKAQPIPISPISLPASVHATASNKLQQGEMSRHQWQRLQSFRHYIDSLGQTVAGSSVLDSMLVHHPGLLDSLTQVENIYQSQFKP